MNGLAVATHSLSKRYGDMAAVSDLNLRVPAGSIYGLLGRNGAGKTTTLRMLLGLTRPTSGEVSVLDLAGGDREEIARRVGFAAQGKMLFPRWSGYEMLRFSRPIYPHWSDEKALEYARRLECPLEWRFDKLSQGNQAKLCLVLAMAQGADLLVLDEPTAGLDPVAIDELLKILVEDFASERKTVLVSSHHLAEIERIADWVGIMQRGRLVLEAELESLRSSFRRISASGRDLPSVAQGDIVSIVSAGAAYEYVVRCDPERFASELRNQGAEIVSESPMNLNEVFLELVR
jgi:ABC-2 type transport system ATP-binding protein